MNAIPSSIHHKLTLHVFVLILSCVGISTLTSSATAIQISIDPGAYSGNYAISGQLKPTSIDLAPGTHTVTIAPSNSFSFSVGEDGSVTPLNPASAEGRARSLTFKTATIRVRPKNYTGTYAISGVDGTPGQSGNRSFVVVPGVPGYILHIAPSNNFRFDVDDMGRVVTPNTAAARSNGDRLIFNNVTIAVDPDDYVGTYSITAVDGTPSQGGRRYFTVLPDVTGYILQLAPSNAFRFDVNKRGHVKVPGSSAATGQLDALVFNNTVITILPKNHTANYTITSVDPTMASGIRHFVLPTGTDGYILTQGPGTAARINVNGAGVPAPRDVTIDQNGSSFSYQISR